MGSGAAAARRGHLAVNKVRLSRRGCVIVTIPRSELSQACGHLWYVFPETLTGGALPDAYYQLMCDDARAEHGRFRFEKGRHAYLVTSALVGTVLSRYVT